jgi:uncharacterized protein
MVFTGDLVNNFTYETVGWSERFNAFTAAEKLAVPGNHDYGDYYRWKDQERKAENRQGIMNAFEAFGFTLLSNHSKPIVRQSDTIFITGVENWGHAPFLSMLTWQGQLQ